MQTNNAVLETEVTPAWIAHIVKSVYMQVSIDIQNGETTVAGNNGIRVYLNVLKTEKLLKFTTYYGLVEDKNINLKHEYVNTLNSKLPFVRFSLPRSEVLRVEYYLSFEGGILPYQIVESLRLFTHVTVSGTKEFNKDDLLETSSSVC